MRKGEKEIIQLEMKIMVPSGGRCWIRQEGGELQSSHVGREGVWGVRGSLAKSASVMREEQGHKGKQPQSDDGACPGLCTTDRNNVHLFWEDRPPQITLHSSPTHTVIPHNTTELYSEPLEQRKATQLGPRMKIYQLNNFSTEEIATDTPCLFRGRCPFVLSVLVALAMETLACLECDGRA